MGWWKKLKDGSFRLGTNVLIDDWIDPRTTDNDTFLKAEKFAEGGDGGGGDDGGGDGGGGDDGNDDDDKTPSYILRKNGYTKLFININEAFKGIVGSPARTLLVYTDVNGGSRVGDQVALLLREVQYKRGGEGSAYFEPMQIQYLLL